MGTKWSLGLGSEWRLDRGYRRRLPRTPFVNAIIRTGLGVRACASLRPHGLRFALHWGTQGEERRGRPFAIFTCSSAPLLGTIDSPHCYPEGSRPQPHMEKHRQGGCFTFLVFRRMRASSSVVTVAERPPHPQIKSGYSLHMLVSFDVRGECR